MIPDQNPQGEAGPPQISRAWKQHDCQLLQVPRLQQRIQPLFAVIQCQRIAYFYSNEGTRKTSLRKFDANKLTNQNFGNNSNIFMLFTEVKLPFSASK